MKKTKINAILVFAFIVLSLLSGCSEKKRDPLAEALHSLKDKNYLARLRAVGILANLGTEETVEPPYSDSKRWNF
jgi:hypothetical protein